jgi:5-formyltetrahydrofolate cyclo-ligase
MSIELDRLKQAARQQALRQREGCDPSWGERLAEHFMASDIMTRFWPGSGLLDRGLVVAGFWPLPGEIDLRPLLFQLAAFGAVLALPVTPALGGPLEFRRWAPGDALAPGRYGTLHPLGPEVQPDWCLTPLLAFDRAGRRLGYGAGYYDRTFAALPHARRFGIAFAAQEFARVPTGPHDMRLSHVATELGVISCDNEDVE